jgi:hypothetical protein
METPSPKDGRAEFVQAVESLLSFLPAPIRVNIEAPGSSVHIVFDGDGSRRVNPGSSPEADEVILSVCTKTPQTSKTIARRAGYIYGAHWRSKMADFTRRGLLVRTPDGLRLPPDATRNE